MSHSPACTGCPSCPGSVGRFYSAILDETPEEAARRLSAENGKALHEIKMRNVSSRSAAKRSNALLRKPGEPRPEFLPAPDSYAEVKASAPYKPTPFDDGAYDPFGTPPNGYLIGRVQGEMLREERVEREERAQREQRAKRKGW